MNGKGEIRVVVRYMGEHDPMLNMEAINVWAGHLPSEAYAQSLALMCGDHWRADPEGGALYAVILQRPKVPTDDVIPPGSPPDSLVFVHPFAPGYPLRRDDGRCAICLRLPGAACHRVDKAIGVPNETKGDG